MGVSSILIDWRDFKPRNGWGGWRFLVDTGLGLGLGLGVGNARTIPFGWLWLPKSLLAKVEGKFCCCCWIIFHKNLTYFFSGLFGLFFLFFLLFAFFFSFLFFFFFSIIFSSSFFLFSCSRFLVMLYINRSVFLYLFRYFLFLLRLLLVWFGLVLWHINHGWSFIPNPFLHILTVLFQTTQFSIIQLQCQKTVPFQTIRFSINTQFQCQKQFHFKQFCLA